MGKINFSQLDWENEDIYASDLDDNQKHFRIRREEKTEEDQQKNKQKHYTRSKNREQ